MIGSKLHRAAWLVTMAAACGFTTSGQAPEHATAQMSAPLPQSVSTATLTHKIATILASPAVARDHWGIQVTTLDGTVLYSLNEAQLFLPASNAKLFTTAAALALLGPNQRFTTRVEYDATGDSSTIDGDVVIVGGGDSRLTIDTSPNQEPAANNPTDPKVNVADTRTPPTSLAGFADEIASSGIKRIKGDIIGDDSIFPWEPYAPDWALDDTTWGYGAPVSGLTVNDNQVRITIRPAPTENGPPQVQWQTGTPPYYTIDAANLITGAPKSGSHVQIEREPGTKTLHLYGSIATDAPPDVEEIALADPAEFAAITLKILLQAHGIEVDGAPRARHRRVTQSAGFLNESMHPLPGLPKLISPEASSFQTGLVDCYNVCPKMLQHLSPPLSDDILITNKTSLNLHAELLLRHLGKQYGECANSHISSIQGCNAQGLRVVRQFLINAGIDGSEFAFFDGSGLSGHDLVTPGATARLLSFAAHDPNTGEPQPWFAAWKASFPVGGVDGTLASRFTQPPLKGHVYAKTGTHGEARALSGYLDAASGRTIIFSIFVGNHLPSTTDDRNAMDQIVAAIQSEE